MRSILILFIVFNFTSPNAIKAQTKPAINSWVELGFGPGYIESDKNLIGGGLIGLTFRNRIHLFSGKLMSITSDSNDGYFDAGLLYGVNLYKTDFDLEFSIQTGVSYLLQKSAPSYSSRNEKYKGIGIPAHAGVYKKFSAHHIMGATIYSNINPSESFFLILFTIRLGAFKDLN